MGGEGTAVAAAGTGGIVLEQMVPVHVGCNPTVRWLRLPQLQEKAMSLLACCPKALGTPASGEEDEETGFQGALSNTQTHSGPVRHLVLSLPSGATAMTLCRAGHRPSSTSSSGRDGGYSPSPVSA